MKSARDSILRRLAACRPEGAPRPACVAIQEESDPRTRFIHELEKLGGEAIVAAGMEEAAQRLRERLPQEEFLCYVAEKPLARTLAACLSVSQAPREAQAQCRVAITEADYLIADTGTIGLRLDAQQARASYLLPEIHIAVGRQSCLLWTLAEALGELEGQGALPTAFVFITGPSRTADIEKTIVIPAHGPERLIVVLVP